MSTSCVCQVIVCCRYNILIMIACGHCFRWGQLKDLPKMGALSLVKDGDSVLTNLGLGTSDYSELMIQLVVLSGIYLSMSWIGLSFFGPSFITTKGG